MDTSCLYKATYLARKIQMLMRNSLLGDRKRCVRKHNVTTTSIIYPIFLCNLNFTPWAHAILHLLSACLVLFVNLFVIIMKRKLKQWWSSMPPISTNRTITSQLNSLNIQIPRHVTLEIQVLACDMDNNMAGLNLLMRS